MSGGFSGRGRDPQVALDVGQAFADLAEAGGQVPVIPLDQFAVAVFTAPPYPATARLLPSPNCAANHNRVVCNQRAVYAAAT